MPDRLTFFGFVDSLSSIRQLENLQKERSQIAAATRMSSSLKEAVLYQSHTTSMRSEKYYTDILTPKQTVLYQDWLSTNRDRCREALSRRKESKGAWSPNSTDSVCLLDVCRKLEEVLKISKKQNP
jgi:hypothetical protein